MEGPVRTRAFSFVPGPEVGETGFEPATARPPAGCATRLRHSPWCSLVRAGDGNRTRPKSLEGSCATTTLRPQSSYEAYLSAAKAARGPGLQTVVAVGRRLARCAPLGMPVVVERRQQVTGPDLAATGALERWFDDAPWGLAVVDLRHRFLRVNAALAGIDGVAADRHAGRAVEEILPGLAAQLAPILRRALVAGETVVGEELLGPTATEPDGRQRWLTSWFPLRGEDGAVQAAAGMLLRLPDLPEGERDVRAREQRMHLAMEATGTGYWEWDVESDRIRWTDGLAILHGLEPGGVPRGIAGLLELVHRGDREGVEAQLRAAVERCGDYGAEYRTTGPEAGERWMAARGRALAGPDGRTALVTGLSADVTDRRRREDALMFLAEASDALAGSLDPRRTMDEIARLAVPRLADWCAVQLASDPQGGFENVAVAHVDPDKVRWALELQERYPPDQDAPTGVPQVIRSGRSELYPEVDEELLRAGAVDEEHLRIIQELRISSAMVVPLRARERTLGAITFIFAESERQYSTHELELAEELGRRAGLALDHARLYEREHRTAETLQRALLPPTLPDIPGHELAARYLPGRAGDHVGGDWYDAFALPDGRDGIAIGDIGGRGITAAALMGQVRNGLRAYALKALGPAEAMADLRAMEDHLSELVFATLTYVVYDPRTGTGALASAGHLPTLVLDGSGGARYTDAPRCPPLGAGATAPCREHRFSLEPGGAFVLYTDGLVESRTRSLDEGLDRLATIARRSGGDIQRLADEIVEALPEQRQDDIALLALCRHR
jgi:serine phosphatase RsbU (regulator of sigma subunit)/PAS domain-containing protein